jgi:hypothetical protein
LPCRMELDPDSKIKCDTTHVESVQGKVCEQLNKIRSELEVIKGLLQDTYLLVSIDDSEEYRIKSYLSDTGEIFVEFNDSTQGALGMVILDSELNVDEWLFYKLALQNV